MNKQQLIEDNMKLVYSIISKEYPTYLHDEDIVQSGMLGLCKAADNWDESKAKFSTYAWKCIRNEINQEFINRKPHSTNVSLETPISEESVLGDLIVGETDVGYVGEDYFYDTLTEDERNAFLLYNSGYSVNDIAEKYNWSIQKTQKNIRLCKSKWRKFNEDLC